MIGGKVLAASLSQVDSDLDIVSGTLESLYTDRRN
jgi:hypothetical protein